MSDFKIVIVSQRVDPVTTTCDVEAPEWEDAKEFADTTARILASALSADMHVSITENHQLFGKRTETYMVEDKS